MNSHQHTVIHNLQLLQQSHIFLHLLEEYSPLLRAKFEMQVPSKPVQVLERRPRVLLQILFLVVSSDSRTFQVESLVDVPVWWEEIVHDYEMNLPSIRNLHSVKAIELRQQSIRILLDVVAILLQYLPQEFVLSMMNRLD